MMKNEDLDRKLERLRSAAKRISANLVELEVDSGRQLLEASALEGESAARWAQASATLTELWGQAGLLEGLVDRAGKLHGSRQSGELRSLLEGPSIELGSSDVPLAERDLLGSSRLVRRCTPDELIARMSNSFDEVKAVVSTIAGAWERLIPELDATRALLAQARARSEELGEAGGDLESASRALDALGASVTTDPLSVSPEDLSRLRETAQSIRDDLEAGAVLMHGFDAQMLDARQELERIRATVTEGLAAREELLVKISTPAGEPVPDLDGELERRLGEVAAMAGTGTWREAQQALEEWRARARTAHEEARRALDANRAPIEARNRFRAMLDAYQVKAGRLGLLEEPAVADIYSRAQQELYTAPTDLSVAGELVRNYQQALSGSRAGLEAKR